MPPKSLSWFPNPVGKFIAKLKAISNVRGVTEDDYAIHVRFNKETALLPKEIIVIHQIPLEHHSDAGFYVITLEVLRSVHDYELEGEHTFILKSAIDRASAEPNMTLAALNYLDGLKSYTEKEVLHALVSQRLP